MTPSQNPDIRIGSGPDIRIGSDHGIQRTDGRTDERTKRTITARSNLTAVDASAGARVESELVKLGDVLAGGFMRERIRHPVVRSGERGEIPNHVRAAVWYRDKGGSDTTDNLRLLCSWHNEDRSNLTTSSPGRRAGASTAPQMQVRQGARTRGRANVASAKPRDDDRAHRLLRSLQSAGRNVGGPVMRPNERRPPSEAYVQARQAIKEGL